MILEVGKTYIRNDFQYKSVIESIEEEEVLYVATYMDNNASLPMRGTIHYFLKNYYVVTDLLSALF